MSKVHYIHLRLIDGTGKKLNRGGATIAFREVGDEIEYAIAKCSPNDNFSRKLGRIKSEGRLNSPRYRQVTKSTYLDFKNSVHQIGIVALYCADQVCGT
jgi:hypothetical protein